MRKILLALPLVVGLCVSGDAQATQNSQTSPVQEVTATSMRSADPDTMFLSGNVEIVFKGGRATADNAVVHRGSGQIELSGNVQLKLDTPQAK